MKGNIFGLIAIIAAVIAFNVPHTSALTVEETCLLVQNATFIADPSSCQGWAYCLNGSPIYGKCGSGLYYDSASGVCNYEDKVTCNTNITTMCTGLTNMYKADPLNCQNYCYCKDGVTYTAACPDGQIFDLSIPACVWPSSTFSCSSGSPCLLVQNGFIKDTRACNAWIRCFNGVQVDNSTCNGDLLYNSVTGKCDYAVNVDCDSSPTAATPASTPVSTADDCPVADKFVSVPGVCNGYFYCAEANKAGTYGTCPSGSQFSEANQQCNDPYSVSPPCLGNRCAGMPTKQKFMAVANTECNGYYVCNSGLNTSMAPCPDDYPIFNELNQVCQIADFNYPICTVTNTD